MTETRRNGWHYIAAVEANNEYHTDRLWSLRELYDIGGKVGWSVDPAAPVGDTREELLAELRRMIAAVEAAEFLDLDAEKVVPND